MKKFFLRILVLLIIVLAILGGLFTLTRNPSWTISQKVLPLMGLEEFLFKQPIIEPEINTGTATISVENLVATSQANPAAVYCFRNGGKSEIVTDASGNQQGFCRLSDGTLCEEREYFRGECPAITIDLTNCISYFDGCNNCSVKDGKPDACTLMYCETPTEPKCLQYKGDQQATPPEEEVPTMCTMEYAPVCAEVAVQCIKAPCPPIKETFGNRCQMNANKLAKFLYTGECAK